MPEAMEFVSSVVSKYNSHGWCQPQMHPAALEWGPSGFLSRWNLDICSCSYKQETSYLHKIHFPYTCVITALNDETRPYFHNNRNAWGNGPEGLRTLNTCDSTDRLSRTAKPFRLYEEKQQIFSYTYLFLLFLISFAAFLHHEDRDVNLIKS